jgi:ribonuclease HII
VIPERDLNHSFHATDNKARTHWLASVRVFRRIWERHASDGIELVVDRHGGRIHYGSLLAQEFPEALVVLVDEEPECSRYSVTERAGPRSLRITFAEKAERLSFAVALASCLAKYARETAMDAFNAWFAVRAPSLRPTAGYNTDARRWLDDAAPVIDGERLDRTCLVRER